jgi:Penicillin-insensitive murein endopeptidase
MGWRVDEVWLDSDLSWFSEEPRPGPGSLALFAPAFATDAFEPTLFSPVASSLEASQRRRSAARADRRRRLATRTVPALALVVGSATMLPMWVLRHGAVGETAGPLQEDPPSLSYPFEAFQFQLPARPTRGTAPRKELTPAEVKSRELAAIHWNRATSVGLWYGGRLVDGTQLPVEGVDWVTWNPVSDSSPNLPDRLFGNERTIRTLVSVIAAYRAAHPHAPRVVIGDISRRGGGRMDDHVSHQNGLDVDVYYPRRDGHLSAPIATSQIDHRLAQDLLDRFVAAGARMIFVGYSTGLKGPSGVVVPYPNHENHMHVRFPQPG